MAAQFKSVTSSGVIANAGAILSGWSLRATGATVVNIYSGTSTSGKLVAVLNLATTTSQTQICQVMCPDGIYLDVASGAVVGSIWFE